MKHSIILKSVIALSMAALLTLSSCHKKKLDVKPQGPDTTKTDTVKKPVLVYPESLSQIEASDMTALNALKALNPKLNLFNGDNPKKWTGLVPVWKKADDGKYTVIGLNVADSAIVKDTLCIDLANNSGHKESSQHDNILFPNLQEINISSPVLGYFSVQNQPKLTKVTIDGQNKAFLTFLRVAHNPLSIDVSISNLSKMKDGGDFKLRNQSFGNIVLKNMPNLETIYRFGESSYDDNQDAVTTSAKTFTLEGDFSNLNQLDLDDIVIGDFINKTSGLKKLASFNIEGLQNKVLTLENMPALAMFNFRRNKNITSIVLNNLTSLKELNVFDNNSLNNLGFTNCPVLKIVSAYDTKLGGKLDLSGFTTITSYDVHDCAYSSIDFGKNVFDKLNFNNNKLTEFNLPEEDSKNIYIVNAAYNMLSTIDFSKMPELEEANVSFNQLVNIICPTLTEGQSKLDVTLECNNNKLPLSVIKKLLNTYNKVIYAPQTVSEGINGNSIDTKNYNSYTLTVQVLNGDKWHTADSSAYSKNGDVYTFSKTGTYRIAVSNITNYDKFTTDAPFCLGNVVVK